MDIKEQIRNTATAMALAVGPQNITKSEVCKAACIPTGSFTHIMGMSFTELVGSLPHGDIQEITRRRIQPEFRKRSILIKAVELAWAGDYLSLTRDAVAQAAKVSGPTVARYFGTMGALKAAVMRYAINKGIVEIIVQGLAVDDRHALQCPQELKKKAAQLIAGK